MSAKHSDSPRGLSTGGRLLLALPALFIGLVIYFSSVNTPFWDQWELVPVMQHMQTGDFYVNDLWQQHNEHRLFFPKLIMVASAYLTHWNTRVEMAISLAIAIGSFLLLIKLWRRSAVPLGLLFLCSMIWFSPVQIENWLWGWQIQWFLSVLGVLVALYGLSKVVDAGLSVKAALFMVGGTILAQYSLGSGTLLWPVLVLALLYLRAPLHKLAAVGLVGVGTTLLYYSRYAHLTVPSKGLAFYEPLAFIKYELLYFGRSLSFYHKPAMLCGLLLLICFAGLAIYMFTRQKDLFRRNIVWIVLGLYAIGSGFVTGLARLGFGVDEAASSRYTTISSLLLISTLIIAYNSRQTWQPYLRGNRVLQPTLIVVVASLVLLNGAWGVHGARTQYDRLAAIYSCTRQAVPSTSCLLSTYPNADIVKPRLMYLKQIHWGGY